MLVELTIRGRGTDNYINKSNRWTHVVINVRKAVKQASVAESSGVRLGALL